MKLRFRGLKPLWMFTVSTLNEKGSADGAVLACAGMGVGKVKTGACTAYALRAWRLCQRMP